MAQIKLIFFIIMLLGAGGGYWYLQNLKAENETLKANNIKLEIAVEQQQQAMEQMKKSFETQGKALQNLTRQNAQIERERNQYLEIFRKHNLDQLAVAKPGMIELRINNGTKQVFKDIENDTQNISNLESSNPN